MYSLQFNEHFNLNPETNNLSHSHLKGNIREAVDLMCFFGLFEETSALRDDLCKLRTEKLQSAGELKARTFSL